MSIRHNLLLLAGAASLLALSPTRLYAQYIQQNLVSDVPGLAASTDPNLVNPWGMAFSATSPFWISDQGSGTAILTDGAGNINSLVVSIPGGGPPSGPTGQVQNSAGFDLTNGNGAAAKFLFDTLNGTIAGWNTGTAAVTQVTTAGAVYTGLAEGSVSTSSYLYAADSAHGVISVFDTNFNNVSGTTFGGKFADPNALAGYVPYNVQLIGGNLYVTYADLLAHGVPAPGSTGYVDEYDTSGNFIMRVATGGNLDAPWGIALAPTTFGIFGGDLLIGNFGNGEIDAYSTGGVFEGTIDGTNGQPLVNSGLWALDFRTGGANNNPNTLYFTAGIDNQQEGLFGSISQTPEPSSFFLAGLGILALAFARMRVRTA